MPRWYYFLELIKKLFTLTIERPSPSDIIPQEDISIVNFNGQPAGVLINLALTNISFTKPPKIWTPYLPDTNSMDPGMDFGHNNILIAGADEADQKKMVDFVKVGDIAVYRVMTNPNDSSADFSKPHKMYAIHRIVQIGYDDGGKYFKFKGDNNPTQDPDRVRENELLWLCIGTIF